MALRPQSSPDAYYVNDIVVDLGAMKVMRGDADLGISGLTFDFLIALIEAAPAMASYDELTGKVWGGRPATPETIAQRAKILRAALGDDARSPKYFELIRGQGYRLIADGHARTSSLSRSRQRVLLAGIAVLLVAGGVALWTLPADEPLPDRNTVAVFPFSDLSPAADHAYLARGMTDVIANVLGEVDGLTVTDPYFIDSNPQLFTNVQNAAERLGVSTYLTGSVSRSGDDMRVITNLIDAATGRQLWTEIFDREFRDIFVVQQTIGMEVAGALGVTLGVTDSNQFIGAGTRDIDAYEAYWRGDYDKAIELDPNYAAAWASKAIGLAASRWYGPPEDALPVLQEARMLIQKAVELEPDAAQTLAYYGTLTYGTWQWEEGWDLFQRALAINRNTENLGHLANMYMRSGRSVDALRIHREADALSPLGSQPRGYQLTVLIQLGLADEASELATRVVSRVMPYTGITVAVNFGSPDDIREAIEALPTTDPASRYLFRPLLEHLESPRDAIALLREVRRNSDLAWPWKNGNIALMAAYFGDPELAGDVLQGELRSAALRLGMLWYPVMSDMRKRPEFKAFLRDIKIVEFWKNHGWSDFCRPVGGEDFVCE